MASKYGRRAETPAHDSEVREPHYPFHSNDSRNDRPHNSRSSGMAKRAKHQHKGAENQAACQHVTCRMAFVSSGRFFSSSIASVVGRTSKLILRRFASFFTSSITGK